MVKNDLVNFIPTGIRWIIKIKDVGQVIRSQHNRELLSNNQDLNKDNYYKSYHDLQFVYDYIDGFIDNDNIMFEKVSIGRTHNNNDLWLYKIRGLKNSPKPKYQILFHGGQHARGNLIVKLRYLDKICRNVSICLNIIINLDDVIFIRVSYKIDAQSPKNLKNCVCMC